MHLLDPLFIIHRVIVAAEPGCLTHEYDSTRHPWVATVHAWDLNLDTRCRLVSSKNDAVFLSDMVVLLSRPSALHPYELTRLCLQSMIILQACPGLSLVPLSPGTRNDGCLSKNYVI